MMLTSDNRSSDVRRCMEAGISGYMVKPVKREYLKEAIKKAIEQREVPGHLNQKIASGDITSKGTKSAEDKRNKSFDILLAEDNPVNQTLAVRMLDKKGHRITVANNGREAVTILANVRFRIKLA